MKRLTSIITSAILSQTLLSWGFFMHKQINYHAVFLLPPEMLVLYKPNIDFLSEHAVDPDKRRYAVASEGSHHYIDIDHYGSYPFPLLPRKWDEAEVQYSRDTLQAHGIVPWWVLIMKQRLTNAFKEKDQIKILRLSADIGHYIADAHVPLHASSNHNGQLTNQVGIHGFWESRIPELFAEKDWDFLIGKAVYISRPSDFIWKRVLESSAASDSVLRIEKKLSQSFPEDQRYAFEEKNGSMIRQYSVKYAAAYNLAMNDMVERRMRQSIFAVASFWYTCWVDAGQPDLSSLVHKEFTDSELKEMQELALQWK
ncbi:MAG TPA: zinc dependent phospholipase C family protein, partial [Puia sp.]|nr:zinc dependent phospholipase C family protein [Puia sp.]